MIQTLNMEVPNMQIDSYQDHIVILEIGTLIYHQKCLCISFKAFKNTIHTFLSPLDRIIKIQALMFKNKKIGIMKFITKNRICTKMIIVYHYLWINKKTIRVFKHKVVILRMNRNMEW